jgi:hypothetical protein
MRLAIAMHSPVTRAICTTLKRMAGGSLVCYRATCDLKHLHSFSGNYDITKMHYDGPGAVPGAQGGGYGYDVRHDGRFSVLSKPVSA